MYHARRIFTLAISKSACPKASLDCLGAYSGDDAILHSTWIAPGPLQGVAIAGVADGVSGWRQYGIDPGKLSRALCRSIAAEFRSGEDSKMMEPPTPINLVRNAFSALKRRPDQYAGGSTLCFGVFNSSTGTIKLLNIGDSGWLILRNNSIYAQSTPSRSGKAPCQLAIVPHTFPHKNDLCSNHEYFNPIWVQSSVEDLVTQEFELRNGDKIVFGTDGLFDNVYPNKLADLVCHCASAERILREAYTNSLDPNYASPLAIRNFEEGNVSLSGGKPDDIAVVVANVKEITLDSG